VSLVSRGRRVADDLRARLIGPGAEFSRNAAVLFVALTLMNASNYAFHVVVSRALGPENYGALSALLSVLLILSVPLNVLQTTVAKRASLVRVEADTDEIAALSAAGVRFLAPFATLAAVAIVALAPVIGALLHVDLLSVVLLAGYVMLSLLLAVPLGALQGALRFRELASVLAVGVAARLGLGAALAHAGYGVDGSLFATLVAPAVSLVLAQRALPVHDPRAPRWSVRLLRGDLRFTLLGLGSFWVLAAVDIVLARHFLRPTVAGWYASADILARALLFLPGAVSTAAFPRFVELTGDPREARRALFVTLGVVGGLSLIGLPMLVVLRSWMIALAFGRSFSPAANYVPVLALAMTFLAVANLLVYFHIATGVRSHVVLLAGTIAEIALIAMFHGSAHQVAWVVLVVSLATTAVLMHAALAVTRRARTDTLRLRPPEPGVTVSLVLPCHNAGGALAGVLGPAIDELSRAGTFEIVVVSDGSTDDTISVAERFAGRGVRVIERSLRGGKGRALRTGLAEARGEYVAFMDSDGDIDPSALRPFLAIVDLYSPDLVIGSKRHPMSELRYPWARRVMSWTFYRLTHALFRLPLRDTQTGAKVIRREVLEDVLPMLHEDGYGFDLELLVAADRLGHRRVFEAPVRIDYRFASQMSIRTPARMLVEALAIAYRVAVLDAYRPPVPASVSTPVGDRHLVAVGTEPRLRILICNWRDIRNPDAGGAEVFTHEVAARWAADGHAVTLVTSRFPGARTSEVIDGVRVEREGSLRSATFHLAVQRRLAGRPDVDVVIDEVNTVPFLTPVWSDALPPVVTLIHQLAEDVWDAETSRPVAAVGRRLEARLLSLYRDAPVVTVSTSTAQDLQRHGFRNVRLVPEGRDISLAGIGEKEARPTFLFVGRLASNKRPDHAVAAFRTVRDRLPDARLWIVGEGGMRPALTADPPEGVSILGRIPRAELHRRMAAAHCLLVPSVREGWGLVITEANALGTPAVGYDVAGIRDAIRHARTGLLVPSGDTAELGAAAASLVADPGAYAAMRAEAIRWGRCFSWDVTADMLMQLLQERVAGAWGPVRDELAERNDAAILVAAGAGA
jgi:glycosyltransferase involved in cell wall biosynthesis/O-antigen/teichoic acid export membrane protein